MATDKITVTIVVPVYSGAAYLARLAEEIEKASADWKRQDSPLELVEIIMVDDGSSDGSAEIMDMLGEKYPLLSPIHLSRNFGQHPATLAGILHSSGDWVVTIDEDLQHPPSRIEDLFRVVSRNGDDVVYARPTGNVHESVFRDASSRIYKRIMEKLSGNPNIRNFNSFRLIRGPLARAAASVSAYDTYFDIALSWFTLRVGSLELDLKDERFISSGISGYKLLKLLSHARRMLMSSGTKVVRGAALLGLFMLAVTSVLSLVILATKLLHPQSIDSPGWTSLMLMTMFLGSGIVILIGAVLEYVATLVTSANGKPMFYVVDRTKDKILSNYFSAMK